MLYEVITQGLFNRFSSAPVFHWEIVSEGQTVYFFVTLPKSNHEYLVSQLSAAYPEILIQELQHDPLEVFSEKHSTDILFRITSYNVCYTKLLRIYLGDFLHSPITIGFSRFSGCSGDDITRTKIQSANDSHTQVGIFFVITSYSIHYTKLYECTC